MTALPPSPAWLSAVFTGLPGLMVTVLLLVLLAAREVVRVALPDDRGRRIMRWCMIPIPPLAVLAFTSILLRFVLFT
ncbi:MAG: hypothetical protein ACRD0K_05970 [Egibacteraceae bacterium]